MPSRPASPVARHPGPPVPGAGLALLFHHRWAAPILAEMHARPAGARAAEIRHALGVGADSFARTARAIVSRGWLVPNPGYGHPLRPEYVLTAAGAELGEPAADLISCLRERSLGDAARRKWPLPVVHATQQGSARFSEIDAELGGPPPRALSGALQIVAELGLVRRAVDAAATPPRTLYAPTRRARPLASPLARLAELLAGAA